MSDIDDNMLEDFDTEPVAPGPVAPSAGAAASAANRPFYIALGVIGAAFLLTIIGMAVYLAVVVPQRNNTHIQAAALINAQNTATSMAATKQVEAMMQFAPTDTPTPVPPTETAAPSATMVIAPTQTSLPTETPAPIIGADMLARTATVSVLLTEAATGNGLLGAAVTPTALPNTGFADEAGVPSLFGAALLLVVVIFLVRRLRLVNNG